MRYDTGLILLLVVWLVVWVGRLCGFFVSLCDMSTGWVCCCFVNNGCLWVHLLFDWLVCFLIGCGGV